MREDVEMEEYEEAPRTPCGQRESRPGSREAAAPSTVGREFMAARDGVTGVGQQSVGRCKLRMGGISLRMPEGVKRATASPASAFMTVVQVLRGAAGAKRQNVDSPP